MILALVRPPLARIARTRRSWLPVVGFAALALATALASRTSGDTSSADHVLRGTFGGVVLPLLAYGIVSSALGGSGLRAAIRGLVALGGDPAKAALATAGVAVLSSALASGALGGLVCALAHGPTDLPLARDVTTSFGVAFLGGAAYAAFFCAGSAIGRGAMRGVFVVVDWVLGASGGLGALFVPRGHVTSLLGGAECFELSRRASSVVLVVLALVYAALAVLLGRRARS